MTPDSLLSFLVPPFPYFIEGNRTEFRAGEWHPDRYHLGYFDVIIVKEGSLSLGEEGREWRVTENHALILEPDKHHYPLAGCTERTLFYWFHFQTNNRWCAQTQPDPILPPAPVPKLHFHAEHTTVHLPKFQRVAQPEELFAALDLLLSSTLRPRKTALWETQQTFMSIIQSLESHRENRDSATQLAEQVEIYLKQHYRQPLTNADLARHFHVHENYLARCMKAAFACTPLEYLLAYRLEQGRLLLLRTDWSVQRITEETGFAQGSYFTRRFKRRYGLSPQQYRKQYRKPAE